MCPVPIRVRFAPSPTGPLHIGGVRTALYNYLFARKHNGSFILRFEDTDQKRLVPGAESYIMDSLQWCGLIPDESVSVGGPFAPYRQSERTAIYRKYLHLLLEKDHAYYAFDAPEDLAKLRETSDQPGHQPFQYDSSTRHHLLNSLTLSRDSVLERVERGDPYVIRLRVPENEVIVFHDLIRGNVTVQSSLLDDKVLFKSDGLPTYHFANIVDDHLMQISHVIRGEEWLPSAPLHLLLYRYLGWETEIPSFAHLPLILKPEGNGKLSKRDGDKLGFPVFPLAWSERNSGVTFPGYRESGYLPQAFINMLALLGWNSGTEQELFSIEELTDLFSLDRIKKSGARFDPEKAKWFNHQYIQLDQVPCLTDRLIAYLQASGKPECANLLEKNLDFTHRVIALARERVSLLSDFWETIVFFYEAPVSYNETLRQKIWKPETHVIIESFLEEVQKTDPWTIETIHDLVTAFVEREKIKMGQLMNPLRMLVVGSNKGPGMIEIAFLIGKFEFLHRVENGLQKQ